MSLELGDYGILDADSHTKCPNCEFDLGYYGDLVKGFTCENCGMSFEIMVEPEFWYTVSGV